MEVASRPRPRFQYSLRTLFAVTAIVALLLVPIVWVARERQQMLLAREAALRAVVLAEHDRAIAVEVERGTRFRARSGMELPPAEESVGQSADNPPGQNVPQAPQAVNARPPVVEQLLRENAELKETVANLRREIERLKPMKGR